MAEDNDEDSEGPAVALGEGKSVSGVPLARVSSRLSYGIEKSTVRRRAGETEIRTPDGPQPLGTVLDELDETYFDRRQSFETAVREVVGTGPVPTE
ncbi:hypothetical protein Hrd1104_09055 [Halorhabdus sp. CBA1104]|uniref:DUF5789 family protein n=1 Tax=unclassified Halorhabdus TaxID=2621901 RepID=UPI0012B19758|nr:MULTISPECIES: DUF5789 family protein [unclassified Halorhabdus]QGN07443.1 hypothetical protein Hrd1104_09055 [Halorhabdus sp. CBA1104]